MEATYISINRGMDKKDVVYIHNGGHKKVTKRNKIGSFLEMWTDLQTVTQSEMTQKKYHILTHKCGV